MTDIYSASLSAVDGERFGVRAAKATLADPADISTFLEFCDLKRVEFAIVRCSTRALAIVQQLESKGFFLTDTLVYHKRNLMTKPIPENSGKIHIRPFRPGEEDAVASIAAGSFKGYFGHYHADPRLDRAKCDEAYVDWAVRACLSKQVAEEVLIAEQGGKAVAFAAMKLLGQETAEGVLFGVAPAAQGQGIYTALHIRAMYWSLSKNAIWIQHPTQITNLASQKVWARLGFEPSQSSYTLHKWFD